MHAFIANRVKTIYCFEKRPIGYIPWGDVMEVERLAGSLANLLAPFLAALAGGNEEAAGVAPLARIVWSKLSAELEREPRLRESVDELIGAPGDPDALALFRMRLKKLLAKNDGLARGLDEMIGQREGDFPENRGRRVARPARERRQGPRAAGDGLSPSVGHGARGDRAAISRGRELPVPGERAVFARRRGGAFVRGGHRGLARPARQERPGPEEARHGQARQVGDACLCRRAGIQRPRRIRGEALRQVFTQRGRRHTDGGRLRPFPRRLPRDYPRLLLQPARDAQ